MLRLERRDHLLLLTVSVPVSLNQGTPSSPSRLPPPGFLSQCASYTQLASWQTGISALRGETEAA